MVISKSTHVAANGITLLFFMAEYYSIVCMYCIFIHYSADGHLGCFRGLAVVNSAAMNISVHVTFLFFNFSFYIGVSLIKML